MAMVCRSGKCGYHDATGRLTIPLIYDEAWPFFNGKAQVRKEGKWFYVDAVGRCVEDCE
jgi:hypothetical protein